MPELIRSAWNHKNSRYPELTLLHALSNAMHLSSWLGHAVELPFDEDLFLEELNKRRANSKKKEHVKELVLDTVNSYGSKQSV